MEPDFEEDFPVFRGCALTGEQQLEPDGAVWPEEDLDEQEGTLS